jgi:hypothetical protein
MGTGLFYLWASQHLGCNFGHTDIRLKNPKFSGGWAIEILHGPLKSNNLLMNLNLPAE